MERFIWKVAKQHSSIHFSARYYKIGEVTGVFSSFSGKVLAGENFEDPEINLDIRASSLETYDTGLNQRLGSDTLLDVINYPLISFDSGEGCEMRSGRVRELHGNLHIKKLVVRLALVVNFFKLLKNGKQLTAQCLLFGTLSLKELGLGVLKERGVTDEITVHAKFNLVRSKCRQPAPNAR